MKVEEGEIKYRGEEEDSLALRAAPSIGHDWMGELGPGMFHPDPPEANRLIGCHIQPSMNTTTKGMLVENPSSTSRPSLPHKKRYEVLRSTLDVL